MLGMKLLNLNRFFAKSKVQHFINDLVNNPAKDLRESLYSVLPNGGEIESYPSCSNGCTKYEVNLGTTCTKCGEVVMHQSEQELEPMLYIKKPAGVKTFINPTIYLDLIEMSWIGRKAFNPVLFLTISNYKPSKEHKAYLAMQAWDVERNWNYFTDNLRELVPRILQLIVDTTSRKFDNEMKAMIDLVNYADELVFTDVLPVINKLILAIEQTGDIKRKSPTTETYGLAITDLISLPTNPQRMDIKAKTRVGNVVGKAYRGLNDFYDETYQREGKKGGLCRSDTLGLRSPFTWRAVIVQICGPHRGDELELPWTAATYLYEPQILQVLGDEWGLSPSEAMEFLALRRRVYCPKLSELFHRILFSFTPLGSPAYHIRYPTLYSQSGQLQYVTRIKSDPEDKTVGVPAAALSGWNGDFDGDELTGNVLVDMNIYEGLKIAHLSRALLDINHPYEFGGSVKLPDPVAQMWCSAVTIHPNR